MGAIWNCPVYFFLKRLDELKFACIHIPSVKVRIKDSNVELQNPLYYAINKTLNENIRRF
jgi:hypothetical protein